MIELKLNIAHLDVFQFFAGRGINAGADGRYNVAKTGLCDLVGKKFVGKPFSFWIPWVIPDLIHLFHDRINLSAG